MKQNHCGTLIGILGAHYIINCDYEKICLFPQAMKTIPVVFHKNNSEFLNLKYDPAYVNWVPELNSDN